MNDLDTLFRAFQEYKKLTSHDRESEDFRKAFMHFQTEEDSLETMRTYPEIYEDWIAKIEEEMVYVEKAVREERQFIRQDGEVVPIEKAKRVSRESVKHLAKHSNNITRMPEDPSDDIIPENIYMVENLSDYAVYENRFLYMLLCYARDFITLRFNKILELGRTFKSNLLVSKNLNYNKRSVAYTAVLNEVHTDSENSPEFKKCKPLIKRIEDQQYLVTALLDTPVMQEVSKSPMLRPPITLTNVLKKNNNFKHALDLYHYLSSYTSKGYEIKEIRARYSPLSEKMLADCAEIALLQSFTAFHYGNRLTSRLTEALKEYERCKKEEAELETRRRLDALRKQYSETEKGLDDYIILLEQHNRMLEDAAKQLQIVTAEKAAMLQEKERLTENIELLEARLDTRNRELRETEIKHAEEITELRIRHTEEVELLNKNHSDEINELKETHSIQTKILTDSHEKQLSETQERYESALATERELLKNANDELEYTKSEYVRLENENGLTKARITALRQKYGDFSGNEDFTSKAGFTQLESEFEYFSKIFFDQWEKTKKRIRKEVLFVLPEKVKKINASEKQKRNVKNILRDRKALSVDEKLTDTKEAQTEKAKTDEPKSEIVQIKEASTEDSATTQKHDTEEEMTNV